VTYALFSVILCLASTASAANIILSSVVTTVLNKLQLLLFTNHVQQVLGTLLLYARAVDSSMLPAISTLPSQQSHGTKATLEALTQ
jgi:hypothetical protein